MTTLLQMSNCTTVVEMFAFLQGDFELAVVHFAVPSEDSLIHSPAAEKTFKYLYEKKKAGSIDKIENCHFTHLFVYALAKEDTLPGLLQGIMALAVEGRSANMLLGLLVRKVSMQTNRTEASRRDPKLDPRLSTSKAVAMQTHTQPQLLRHCSLTSRISKAAHAPPQESPQVAKAQKLALSVDPVQDLDSDEEISCLNADGHAFFRQMPIGQRIPVLLNRVPEYRKNPRLSGVNTNVANLANR